MIFLQSEKLNISYWESLLEINSLKLCLSENLLFSFLLLKDNFSGYRIVYFPVNSLNISLHSPCLQGFWEVWWSSFQFWLMIFPVFWICYAEMYILVIFTFSLFGSVVWCLTVIWRNSQPLLLQIFVYIFFWYFHYVYVTTFSQCSWILTFF